MHHFHPRPKDFRVTLVKRRRKMHAKLAHVLSRRSNVVLLALVCALFLTVTRLRRGADGGGGSRAGGQWSVHDLLGTGATDGGGAGKRPPSSSPPRRPTSPETVPPLPLDPPHREVDRPVLEPGECIPEIEYLKRPSLGLADKEILYSRRCIRPVWRHDVDRDVVTNISRPLVTKRARLDLAACSHVEYVPCDHMTLDVPYPYPLGSSYAHLLFGVATPFDRLSESLASFKPWLAGTQAELLAIVTDAEEVGSGDEEGEEQEARRKKGKTRRRQKPNLVALQAEFRAANMSATLMRPSDATQRTSQIHFTMLADLVARVTPETEWIGLLDDDTFFPSLHPVASALAEHDHTVPQYLGALSEDFGAVRSFGYMAFGGAGVFLSVPLARELVGHMDECIAEAAGNGPGGFEGDGMLRDCIHHHSTARLTQVGGLWQQDMYMDASGFFEAGLRVLSLHHWKSWYRAPVVAMAMVAGMCGNCFLQRWRFGNDTVFTNGYSVAVYRDGLDGVDLDQVEGTWYGAGRDFEFNLGPIRPALPSDAKKSFRLVDSEIPRWGSFRQIYVHRADPDTDEPDEVIELLWEG